MLDLSPKRNLGTPGPAGFRYLSFVWKYVMRIGIVFHKNAFAPPSGIDLVRLRAISLGLIRKGVEAEIIAPVQTEGTIEGVIPVRKLDVLNSPNQYDLVKTCYHDSIMLIRGYQGPVISRIVRVVDQKLPERDDAAREKLLHCQEMIKKRAVALVLNNKENEDRWRDLYGDEPQIILVPTGCPAEIPKPHRNPFQPGEQAILFLGSVASPRMVRMLNEAARNIADFGRIHLIGLNKAGMYGGDEDCRLDPIIVDHGELSEAAIWDYIQHARIGLALATGPYPFDNDVSKIFNYLRGGLPVLSEEQIVNNYLIRQTGLGRIFRFDDMNDLTVQAKALIMGPVPTDKRVVMRFMAEEHSWDKRVETYLELFRAILHN